MSLSREMERAAFSAGDAGHISQNRMTDLTWCGPGLRWEGYAGWVDVPSRRWPAGAITRDYGSGGVMRMLAPKVLPRFSHHQCSEKHSSGDDGILDRKASTNTIGLVSSWPPSPLALRIAG
jgi:hypothetical protein